MQTGRAEGSIGLDLQVETPENAFLTYQLAGPAWRGLAYAIDLAIRLGVLLMSVFFLALGSIVLPGLSMGAIFLLVFLLEWGYSIGFEGLCRGQTPGKMLCGLRVRQESGEPLSWWSAVLRNLLRVADTLPLMLVYAGELGPFVVFPVYGPALIAMTLSGRLQRLGDLAARTVVVHETRGHIPLEPLILERIEPLPRDALSGPRPTSRTLSLIERFLGRRSVLTYERGHQLAGPLAYVVARQLGDQRNRQQIEDYPMAYLARVYVTFSTPQDEPVPQRQRRRSVKSLNIP